MSKIYRLPADDRLLVHSLDNMAAIYQVKSGQTHMVADPVPDIVDILREGGCDLPSLVSKLQARYDLQSSDDVSAVVAARLNELIALGLVVSA